MRFNDFEYAVNLRPEAGVQPILVTVLVLTLAHRRHYTAKYLKVIRFVEYRFLVVGTISLVKMKVGEKNDFVLLQSSSPQ